jgi:TPR repeat protein
MKLRPCASRPHIQMAKVYRAQNKIEKAIKCAQEAESLDHSQEITDLLHELRHENFSRTTRLVPSQDLQSQMDRLTDTTHVEPLDINDVMKKLTLIDPLLSTIAKAHEYRDGQSLSGKKVVQDLSKAAELYKEAALQGSPEGMYSYGQCLYSGRGCKKNMKEGLKWYRKAANWSNLRSTSIPIRVIGVAEAQYALGNHYHVVEKIALLALEYYESAMRNGLGQAGNNLGLMFMHGECIPTDLEKAKKCFSYAYQSGEPLGAFNMVKLLCNELLPEEARVWNQKLLNAGHIQLDQTELINMATEFKNSPGGIIAELKKIMEPPKICKSAKHYDFKMLHKYASDGSKAATRYLLSFEKLTRAGEILMLPRSDHNDELFVTTVSDAIFQEYKIIEIHDEKALKIIKDVLRKTDEQLHKIPNDEKALDLDLRARVCWIRLHLSDIDVALNCLNSCIKIHTECEWVYECRGGLNNFKGNNEAALRDFNRVIELNGKWKVSCLYLRAATLRIMRQLPEAIKGYQEFIAVAEKDDYKLPEAFYSMATCISDRTEAHLLYKKGVQAEKDMLPLYLPYESQAKSLIATLLELKNGTEPKVVPKQISSSTKLKDIWRTTVLLKHRTSLRNSNDLMNSINQRQDGTLAHTTVNMKVKQEIKNLINLKEIFLSDMDTTRDHIYQQHIHLTSIDAQTHCRR